MMLQYLIFAVAPLTVTAFTPHVPTAGWTYHVEAAREGVWPSCAYRFLSYDSSCKTIDLWKGAGINQEWTLIDAGDGLFYLRSSCGSYLSYPGDCNSHALDMWPEAGVNQKFRFVVNDNTGFEYYLEAVGRQSCEYRWASFPVQCTTNSPDIVDLWKYPGTDQKFRIHPFRSSAPLNHHVASDRTCADPFVWWSAESNQYLMQCTGGGIGLTSTSTPLGASSTFKYQGDCLGRVPAPWASASAYDSRWAPENHEYKTGAGTENFLFFADSQPDGIHRIGWVASTKGASPAQYTTYSSTYLNLGGAAGGDID